jgi:transcriptional regulator with XRE-family HTH domain
MPRPNRNSRSKPPRRLFLGLWLKRLNRKQAEIAEAAGITPTYVSELVNDPGKNPSPTVLLDISEALGLTVNDLYNMPPAIEATEAAGKLNPAQLATLGRLLDEMKPIKRR